MRSSNLDLEDIFSEAPMGLMYFVPVRNQRDDLRNFKLKYSNTSADTLLKQKELEKEKKILLDDIFPKEVKKRWLKQCITVFSTGESVQVPQAMDLGGIEYFFRIHVQKMKKGIALYVMDISDLNEMILSLKEDEKKYRNLFETSLDAIFIADESFHIISFNPRFSALLDYTDENSDGLFLGKIFKNDTTYKEFSERLKEKQYVKEFEAQLLTRHKELKFCVISCIPVIDEETDTFLYQGVIRDVTEKRQTEKDLIMAEKLSLTGKLSRSIAHEIRNPLTNLRLALDQFKDELPDDLEDSDFYIDLIQRNADRINNLINDLLKSSRPKELNIALASVNDVIEETLVLIRDRLKLKEMILEVKFEEKMPPTGLDKDQLKIAILNLLLNAVEAMESGKGKLMITTAADREEVLIKIRDNGKGISEDQQHHLFEPFFTAKKEGTGLGLTTTQNIIHAHRGKIEVNSELGRGTEFVIHLPRQKNN